VRHPYAFDFGQRYLDVGPWRLAFCVFTEANVYTPAPDRMKVTASDGRTEVTADTYAWAGLQQRTAGRFRALITRPDPGSCSAGADEIQWHIEAWLPERIKGTATYVQGVAPGDLSRPDLSFQPLRDRQAVEVPYPACKFPAWFLRHSGSDYTFAVTEDNEVCGKTCAATRYGDGVVLELHHHEDARKWSMTHTTPAWHLGKTSAPPTVIGRRLRMMEQEWGLKPWEERADVPAWAREICLVLNLHGAHWTGFVLNDYARQLAIVEHVCSLIPGRHVLAFLPAWDGRYNYNWPRYEPDEAMGGAGGFARLIHGCHRLGVRAVPMFGAVSANRTFLPPALHDCAFQDAFGNAYVKPVEWDGDHMPDTYRVNANMGHPGFRQFLVDKISALRDRFGFDGAFLDISQAFFNDPRFHVTEGHRALAQALHERHEDFLVFGEGWYDGLMPVYPLVHQAPLAQWNEVFERYCRITYHLNHPAPGWGSPGVYETGRRPPFRPDPDRDIIPTIAFVEDTLAEHKEEIKAVVDVARQYGRRKGMIAGTS